MKIKLKTVEEVIDAFGGPTAIGAWLGIGQSAVSNWKIDDAIPPGWHLRLARHAERHGFVISDDLFGLPTDDPKAPTPRVPKSRKADQDSAAA